MKLKIIFAYFTLTFLGKNLYSQTNFKSDMNYYASLSKNQRKNLESLLEPTLSFGVKDNGMALRFLSDSVLIITPLKLPIKYGYELNVPLSGRYNIKNLSDTSLLLQGIIHDSDSMGISKFFEFGVIFTDCSFIFSRSGKQDLPLRLKSAVFRSQNHSRDLIN